MPKVKNNVSVSVEGNLVWKKTKTFDVREKKDYKKVNKTRRDRGYSFEYSIVNAFNNHPSKQWHARRLGGSSTGLPDIVATNNDKSILYSIECKSGESNILYVPRDQIDRCKDITDKFLRTYKNRFVVLVFKFKGSKKKGTKLQYRIIVFPQITLGSIKGFSYNIITDEINAHFTTTRIQIREHIGNPISSIDQFVNWR